MTTSGLAGAVLEVGEEGVDRVGVLIVDGEDAILGEDACACGGSGFVGEVADLDGDGLLYGNKAELVEVEVVGVVGILGFDEEAGVDALAVVQVGEGRGVVEVGGGALEDVAPGGVFLVVEVDDLVAALDAGAGDGAAGGDVVGDGGLAEEGGNLVIPHVGAGEEDEGEDEVGDGAGDGDEDALPAGMVLEFAGIEGGLMLVAAGDGFVADAGHFDVAAKGDEVDAVVGAVVDEAEEALAEADGEGFDADAAELGDEEVAELVHDDHDAEHDGEAREDHEAGGVEKGQSENL